MPWKVRTPMGVRKEFIERLLQGEKMSELCHQYGISRKTGYKFKERYLTEGASGLADRSRAPRQPGTKTPEDIEKKICAVKRHHPSWGAKKLKVRLDSRYPGVYIPSVHTIHRILDRNNLVTRRLRKQRIWPFPDGLTESHKPNDVWCADFKGHFRLGDGAWCYPLTISDHYSRFLICCEGLDCISSLETQKLFEQIFRRYGLPRIIRTDNGAPFASLSVSGLSKLSVWWLRLGIQVERIAPGHPEQNGRHERMHLTLKRETTRPAAYNILQQQERFDRFREEYNTSRPHEALKMGYPSNFYTVSERPYPERLEDLKYPLHDRIAVVSSGGQICALGHRSIFIGKPFVDQELGLREISPGNWLVSFLSLDIGSINEQTGIFSPMLK